jgi:branched-chain amino acid transport system permease protein
MTGDDRLERVRELLPVSDFVNLRTPIGILLIVLLLRPTLRLEFVLGGDYIAISMLIWMLFAAAYNLLLGYAGLLSFGHAMFLGAGAYGIAMGLARFDIPFVAAGAMGVVLAAALANAIGRLTVDRGEIYFAMLTLAFAMAAHFIVNADPFDLTGGADGIRAGAVPEWVSSFRGQTVVQLAGVEFELFYLVAVVFLLSMLALWQIIRSPFGRTLVAIRDNEELARAMGISTNRYKVRAFTLSGAFSAIAGTMLVLNNGGVSLEDIGVLQSGNVLLMTIFGGMNYFFGPITGVFAWFIARESLTSFEILYVPVREVSLFSIELGGVLTFWQFFFGLAFVVLVLVAPEEGIWGFVRSRVGRLGTWLRRRWTDE